MIMIIDHFDSFVHNLARYFVNLGCTTCVIRSDKITPSVIEKNKPSHIVFSPGPCSPYEAKKSLEVVKQFHKTIPMLGVCLGHQIIAQALGGSVTRAQVPMHGKHSLIQHNGQGLFFQIPNPMRAGRYHSLIVDNKNLPEHLQISAVSPEGEIMAFKHKNNRVFGVQFHPESILTIDGVQILKNFITP